MTASAKLILVAMLLGGVWGYVAMVAGLGWPLLIADAAAIGIALGKGFRAGRERGG